MMHCAGRGCRYEVFAFCSPDDADLWHCSGRRIQYRRAPHHDRSCRYRGTGSVFYPTHESEAETRFGPWELSVARNSAPASGHFPLIAISHGLSGNDWNHHLLASRLVKAGFVVAAVRHPDDLLRVGQPKITVLRPRELTAAIDAVLTDSRFGPIVDAERIGAFGFSLGGFTVLVVAGGRIEYEKIARHCSNAEKDPEYCIGEEGG